MASTVRVLGEDRGAAAAVVTEGAPTSDPCLDVMNLSKTFAARPALDALYLRVDRGEIHALVGENGSGKSTLIKILSGYHVPDPDSEVRVAGEPLKFGSPDDAYALGCRFVHQDLGLVETSSILDNMSFNAGFPTRLGTIRSGVVRRQVQQDLARVGLSLDPRLLVSELSPALRTGVAIARALHVDPQVPAKLLVLDEATATLPSDEAQRLMSILRTTAATGVGILYVTHHLGEVFDLADNVTVLRDGVKVTTVPASSIDRRGLITLLVGRELEEVRAASASLRSEHGDPFMRVKNLASGELVSLSFDLRAGDIIGLAGLAGSGRETVLGSLFGTADRDGGQVLLDGRPLRGRRPDLSVRRGLAYLPPSRKQAGIMEFTGRENLTLSNLRPFWRRGVLRLRSERREAAEWFDRMDVRPSGASEKPLATFSGGNQQKILLGKLLRCIPKALLLDEPTQGVDVGSKADIHGKILDAASAGAAVVVGSADVDELVALCHRVLVLKAGHLVADLKGQDLSVSAVSHASLGALKVKSA